MSIAFDIQVLMREFASNNEVDFSQVNCLQTDQLEVRFPGEALNIKAKPEYQEAEALIPTEGVKLVSFWLA